MSYDYPWYEKIEFQNSLLQGDILWDCPIIIPPTSIPTSEKKKASSIAVEVETFDCIVMSQSCDLENGKVDYVLVCPFWKLNNLIPELPESQRSEKGLPKFKAALKQSQFHNYHLLNIGTDVEINDFLVVDFRNVHSLQIDFLKSFASQFPVRARLLPPYREHLSQAFARFFMRVGLPQNIAL